MHFVRLDARSDFVRLDAATDFFTAASAMYSEAVPLTRRHTISWRREICTAARTHATASFVAAQLAQPARPSTRCKLQDRVSTDSVAAVEHAG